MKYFFVRVTTQYDGYEWVSLDLIKAQNEQEATKRAEKRDYTHDNDIELQEIESVEEIPYKHFQVLKQYL